MNILKRLKIESALLRLPGALISLCAGVVTGLVCIIACGNFYLYSFLLLPRHAPPTVMFLIIFALSVDLLFFVSGLVFFSDRCSCKTSEAVFLMLAALFLLLFYISFMRCASFVLALLMLLCSVCLQVLAFIQSNKDLLLPMLMQALIFILTFILLWLDVSVILLN